jgi:hypothetical protein
MMIDVLITVAPLFLIILASALIQRTRKLGDDWSRVLNEFALDIGMPALIFAALARTGFTFAERSDLLLANSLFLLGTFALAFLAARVLRIDKARSRTLFICLPFGNIAYLGIPTLNQIYGEGILSTVSIIVAVYLFWVFTVGIAGLHYSQHQGRGILGDVLGKLYRNPPLIAVVLGMAVAGFGIPIPSVLMQAVDKVAASVTPVVLVVIGLFIGKSTIGHWREWIPVLLFTAVTLFALPAAFYFGVKFSGASPDLFRASIIEAAMPLAITPFALADEFGLDKTFIARSIVLSTVLSAVTIPFWASVLGFV